MYRLQIKTNRHTRTHRSKPERGAERYQRYHRKDQKNATVEELKPKKTSVHSETAGYREPARAVWRVLPIITCGGLGDQLMCGKPLARL